MLSGAGTAGPKPITTPLFCTPSNSDATALSCVSATFAASDASKAMKCRGIARLLLGRRVERENEADAARSIGVGFEVGVSRPVAVDVAERRAGFYFCAAFGTNAFCGAIGVGFDLVC